jgi:hypothetical protein
MGMGDKVSLVLSKLSHILHGDEASMLLRDALREAEESVSELKASLVESSVALIATRRDLAAALARVEDLEHAYAGSIAIAAATVAAGSSSALRSALVLEAAKNNSPASPASSSLLRRNLQCRGRGGDTIHAIASAIVLGTGAAALAVAATQMAAKGGPLSLHTRAAAAAAFKSVASACTQRSAPECPSALGVLFSISVPWLFAFFAAMILFCRARRKRGGRVSSSLSSLSSSRFAITPSALAGASIGVFYSNIASSWSFLARFTLVCAVSILVSRTFTAAKDGTSSSSSRHTDENSTTTDTDNNPIDATEMGRTIDLITATLYGVIHACALAVSLPRVIVVLLLKKKNESVGAATTSSSDDESLSVALAAWWLLGVTFDAARTWNDGRAIDTARRRFLAALNAAQEQTSSDVLLEHTMAGKTRSLLALSSLGEAATERLRLNAVLLFVIILACGGVLPGFLPFNFFYSNFLFIDSTSGSGSGGGGSGGLVSALNANGHALFLATFVPVLATYISR